MKRKPGKPCPPWTPFQRVKPQCFESGCRFGEFHAFKEPILGTTDVVIGPVSRPIVLRKLGKVEKMGETAICLFENR